MAFRATQGENTVTPVLKMLRRIYKPDANDLADGALNLISKYCKLKLIKILSYRDIFSTVKVFPHYVLQFIVLRMLCFPMFLCMYTLFLHRLHHSTLCIFFFQHQSKSFNIYSKKNYVISL